MSRFMAKGGGDWAGRGSDEEPADAALLARHVAGDRDAFAQLVRRHRDRLWAIALRTAGDPEEAADAVQDALLAAFRKAGTFRGDSAVTTWLHRIVVNACLDRVRRRAARPTVPLVDQETMDPDTAVYGPVRATSPDPAPVEDLRLDVTAALARLPIEQRAALVLVDMQGFSVEEAARILDVAVGTVKSRCARGRARLRPWVAHLDPSATGRARNQDPPSGVQLDGPPRGDTENVARALGPPTRHTELHSPQEMGGDPLGGS